MKITIIIPSLNPDEKLVQVVDGLVDRGFEDIVIVDDGSDEIHKEPFSTVEKYSQVHLLHHDVNKGKGRALKTAFQYCIQNRPNIDGVVTVDGDNQHMVADIYKCSERMVENTTKMILGVRDFSGENVPFKSRFGNNLTKSVFKVACGLKISDTQTGLRAIPRRYLSKMIDIKGERFEYETNMLLECKKQGIGICEEPIDTVYIEENASTHFNPLWDSLKIYGVIFRFIASSLAASVIDIISFTILNYLLGDMDAKSRLLIATVGARIISSIINYILNEKAVFNSDVPRKKTIMRYYVLCGCQMLASYGLVWLITDALVLGKILTAVSKVIVDTSLFFISFKIQRNWVFK
ncbi:MAG: bifunctional glycosyltransferase family 2/GtrA family protein [Lachnospiraceae bacterium]|nr:bifunctional glycosyltransferase family 2/GtrA family protein [Lachnospiraceae bacterium]